MIEIKNLCKSYGSYKALDGVSLNIEKGELFGFVGANGAGKTTTIKICVGLMAADSGEVYIDGEEVLKQRSSRLKRKVGYVPDFFGVYDNLTAMEYLQFFAATYGIWGTESDSLCRDLLELVNLSDKANTNVDSLSRGMKQRLCLARALVHNPEILFLDEPASGLDPKARHELKEILKNLSEMGKTIIISSHILSELAEMCTSIGIIDKGKIITSGSIEEIQRTVKGELPINIALSGDTDKAVRLLRELPLTHSAEAVGNKITVSYDGGAEEDIKLLKRLVDENIPVMAFYRQESSLESLFLEIMEDNGGKTA